MAALEAARKKLEGKFSFEDLPATRDDGLWDRIEREYHLTLPEVSALKNARCPAQQGFNPAMLAPIMEKLEKLDLVEEEMRAQRMSVETLERRMPKSMITHVINPSTASKAPQTLKSLFDTLGLKTKPTPASTEPYALPTDKAKDKTWKFAWTWPEEGKDEAGGGDDNGANDNKDADDDTLDDAEVLAGVSHRDTLEDKSYKPIAEYLHGLGMIGKVVGDGQQMGGGGNYLFNHEIYTLRQADPRVHGQRVHLRHIIRGRSDVLVLSEDPGSEPDDVISRYMVKFAIEVKTKGGMQKSKSGSRVEAMVQLIGLNVDNERRSPPVVLTNLCRTHSVFFIKLETEAPSAVSYTIYEQECSTFAAAIHFASSLADKPSVTEDLSRPPTPDY